MTTTEEVPMPFSPYLVSEWTGPEMVDRSTWTAYTADQLRAYADARCAKIRAELVEVMNAETQARRERDALAEKVKAMEDNDRRYRWLRDNRQRRRDGDYMNPAFCGVEFYHRAEGIIGPGPDLDAAIDAASGGQA